MEDADIYIYIYIYIIGWGPPAHTSQHTNRKHYLIGNDLRVLWLGWGGAWGQGAGGAMPHACGVMGGCCGWREVRGTEWGVWESHVYVATLQCEHTSV